MGTNFYGRQIQVLNELEEKQIRIEEEIRSQIPNSSTELDDVITDYFNLKRSEILTVHIGKRSVGWAFLFDHNNWEFYKDWDSFLTWCETVQIENEYGQEFTTEEFLEEIKECKDREYAQKSKRENSQWYVKVGSMEFSSSTNFS